MNKYQLLSLALSLSAPIAALADGNVSGRVVNKQTGEPMDFVTIQIFNSSTGKPLNISASTAEDGSFKLPNIPDGKYVVHVNNVGSVNQERPVQISGADVSLGTIKLADDSKVLKEVVVEGIRSQMRFELDKKVFQVDANIASAGQSASELLESIPSVEVDQDGEVSLRGNSSVTVWINGKESGLSADNRAQILEQIPAETIESIEVITNPSAKYSPEGTAGIINIVLKKNRKAGYFGSAELSANSRGGGNASVNINYTDSKWDAYASVGFRMRHSKGGSLMKRDFSDGTHTYSEGDSRNHGNNLFVRLGGTYHLTSKDEFSLSGFGMFGHRWGHSTTIYNSTQPGLWTYNKQFSANKSDNRGAHGEFGYSHTFSDKQKLDANVSYNYWGGPQLRRYLDDSRWDNLDPVVEDREYREQEMPLNVTSWEAKIDYSNTFNQYLKLEAGFNGNYSRENSPNSTRIGTSEADMRPADALYNRFIYKNNISALYLTLGGKVKSFSWSAGVRGETWQVQARSLAYGQTESEVTPFKRSRFALFPSVYLSYALPHDNELQINYTRRIRRPWGGQLNSFRDISDPTSVSYGNPELDPEFSNSFELNYLKTWTRHMISVSAYMRQASDVMNRLSYMEGDVMYSTWANASKRINSGVEIVGKNQLFQGWLDLTTTVNLYQNHISSWQVNLPTLSGGVASLSNKSQNSFAWDARIMANVKLPWQLAFQATGNYNSEQRQAQGSRQGSWSVDLGLRKTLGNWSFSLNCRDLFDSRKWKNTTIGRDYTQYSERWRGGRTVRLTIKYSFGNMKAKRTKNNAEPIDVSGYGSMEE
ncbi:MAG: TonB-dependent receptor family protein [Muribaculaceae bacterium]|nr:TonB-dependent receptor family protein [Muribaculaceae bacterium]